MGKNVILFYLILILIIFEMFFNFIENNIKLILLLFNMFVKKW